MSTFKAASLLPDVQLQPHQERIFGEASDHPIRKLLLHTLGSGKTLTGIAAAEAQNHPYTAVVPASLRNNLRKEQERFTDGQTPSDVMSYTALAKGHPVEKLHTVLFDEAQRLRNAGSKQSLRAQELARQAHQLILMSGTPLVNRPGDLAPLLSMLTQKPISPEDFEKRYVTEREVKPGLLKRLLGVTPGTETVVDHPEELKALLRGHVDYYSPDKPTVPVNYQDVDTEMTAPQTRLYKAFWDQLPWLLRYKLKHDFPLSQEELRRAQSFLTGPRQVGLSTLPYLRNKDPLKAFSQSAKLQKAHELLTDKLKDPRMKALVFSNFIDAGLTPYAAALRRDNVPHGVFHGGLTDAERKKLVDDYNSSRIRVALLGPSGAEGLSFRGTQLAQLLDPHWASARARQAEGRGIRFDSHLGLPEDLQNVTVQRFIARLPLGLKDQLLSRLGFDRAPNRRASDDYLRTLAERKDRVNKHFLDLLREVGTEKKGTRDDDDRMDGLPWLDLPPVDLRLPARVRDLEGASPPPVKGAADGDLGVSGSVCGPAVVCGSGAGRLPAAGRLSSNEYPDIPPKQGDAHEQPVATVPGVAGPVDGRAPGDGGGLPVLPVGAGPAAPAPGSQATEQVLARVMGGDLARLHEAKRHSDVRDWSAKHGILVPMMQRRPHDWRVDSDEGGPVVGVTHRSGWRFHLPRAAVPGPVWQGRAAV